MSFSFEFYARTPGQALLALQEQHAPELVKALVSHSLAVFDEDQPVVVKAHGHIPKGPSDYAASSCDIKVAPIDFFTPPDREDEESPERSHTRDLVQLKTKD